VIAIKDVDELLRAAETLEAWNRERNPFFEATPQLRSDLGNSAATLRASHAALVALEAHDSTATRAADEHLQLSYRLRERAEKAEAALAEREAEELRIHNEKVDQFEKRVAAEAALDHARETYENGAKVILTQSARMRAERDGAVKALGEAELAALRNVCGEVYQVVGALSHAAGQNATAVLDNLDAACRGKAIPHDTLLPYTIAPLAGVDAGDEDLAGRLDEHIRAANAVHVSAASIYVEIGQAAARLRALSARVAEYEGALDEYMIQHGECDCNGCRMARAALSPPAKDTP
jgi:hypothetical protein